MFGFQWLGYNPATMSELRSIIQTFTAQLTALIDSHAMARARAAVLEAFGATPPLASRQGRPPKSKTVLVGAPKALPKKARKKMPKQFCPVPGCKNPAAPVFGMVCAKHKDVAKSKIKKYREARRAKKLGLPIAKTKTKTKTRAIRKAGAREAPAAAPIAAQAAA
jgi:hypothetical protein